MKRIKTFNKNIFNTIQSELGALLQHIDLHLLTPGIVAITSHLMPTEISGYFLLAGLAFISGLPRVVELLSQSRLHAVRAMVSLVIVSLSAGLLANSFF